jgi:hypothetical protein
MRTPSPPYSRLDLAPPSADQFIIGLGALDGPVLLLMPFGFRLTADTLPSGNCESWLQVRLGCFRLSCPLRLGFSIPSSLPASEALPPPLDTMLLIRAPEGLEPS